MAGDTCHDACQTAPHLTCEDTEKAGKAGEAGDKFHLPLSVFEGKREGQNSDDAKQRWPNLTPAPPALTYDFEAAFTNPAPSGDADAQRTPAANTTSRGTCQRCQQPNTLLVGVDRKGRPACGDCQEAAA